MNWFKTVCKKCSWVQNVHVWYWKYIELPAKERVRCWLLKKRYSRQLFRIRGLYGKRKIRVIFPLSNTSKRKCQSLYNLMAASETYDPIVAITLMDVEVAIGDDRIGPWFSEMCSFLESCGCKYVSAFDIKTRALVPLEEFHPDIVWYTQPWRIGECQDPFAISHFALSCYIPYFVENYGGLDMSCLLSFHRELWRHFVPNKEWATVYMEAQDSTGSRAGEIVGCGHPMLDLFSKNDVPVEKRQYVIYAPHWSCDTSECFSTFLKNGEKILSIAKSHPELEWVFKPHPSLKFTLEKECGWSAERINTYYASWERIGHACYSGDYVDVFKHSKVMITDCGSFLVEYPCTGMPLIRLVSSNAKYKVHPISAKLFSTYYEARNWEEFLECFDRVVLKGDDYKRSERLAAVKEKRLCDSNAAQNILEYLDKVLEV